MFNELTDGVPAGMIALPSLITRTTTTQPMKLHQSLRHTFTILLATFFAIAVNAGTFKRIEIDGAFGDWAGVPVAYTDSSETTDRKSVV